MTCTKRAWAGLLLAALVVAGCGDKAPEPKAGDPKAGGKKAGDKTGEQDHTHGAGPNGGVTFDLGKYHAEFTVNHDKQECAVLLIDGHDARAKPLAVAATELTLTTKPTKSKDGKDVPALTVTLKPADAKDGKASKFVGTNPGLGTVADFEGTVVGEIDKKPAEGEFKE